MRKKKAFWLGAPISDNELKKAILTFNEYDSKSQLSLMNIYTDRVTAKSSALLNVAGIVFAISLFVLQRHESIPALTSSFLSVTAILMVCLNFGTVWYRDHSNFKPSDDYVLDNIRMAAARMIRMQLALWLICISTVLSFFALALPDPAALQAFLIGKIELIAGYLRQM